MDSSFDDDEAKWKSSFNKQKDAYRQSVEASANDDGTTMKSSCVICDFTLHEAAQVSIDDFHPLLCFTVVTPYVITSQTVYRHIDAVNSHSPPLVV